MQLETTSKASTRRGAGLRPVDLAREHGISTQAVRNYEDAGILPPAQRTESGYRAYHDGHAAALRTFLALVPAHGHRVATAIMCTLNEGRTAAALNLIDESHAQLLDDRRTLIAVERALGALAPETRDERGPGRAVLIGTLSRQLGIQPATLRKWERAGIVSPQRDPVTGYRRYGQAEIREARLAQQLRRGGFLLSQVASLVERVREAGGVEPLEATLADWNDRLTLRGLAMLKGSAALAAYVAATRTDDGEVPPLGAGTSLRS